MPRATTKRVKWLCNECGAAGEEPTRRMAISAFTAHYGEAHNEVPWSDDVWDANGPP